MQEWESQDTYELDDHETSITGGTWHEHVGEQQLNRVSYLHGIYTNRRTHRNNPRQLGIQRGTRKSVSCSHCLTGYTVSREPRHYELVEQIDEWVGNVHLIAPASTFRPE